jgi:hypothetical protein
MLAMAVERSKNRRSPRAGVGFAPAAEETFTVAGQAGSVAGGPEAWRGAGGVADPGWKPGGPARNCGGPARR